MIVCSPIRWAIANLVRLAVNCRSAVRNQGVAIADATCLDRAISPIDIVRELRERFILEGGFRRAASCLRVTAQSIDAVTSEHLGVDRYDLNIRSIFAAHDDITGQITMGIESAPQEAEIAAGGARLWSPRELRTARRPEPFSI